jgi:hypothetical protein
LNTNQILIDRNIIKDGICSFCDCNVDFATVFDGEISLSKTIPLPGINLNTGEKIPPEREPFWEIRVITDGVEDFFEIFFCPFCGKKLPILGQEESYE